MAQYEPFFSEALKSSVTDKPTVFYAGSPEMVEKPSESSLKGKPFRDGTGELVSVSGR